MNATIVLVGLGALLAAAAPGFGKTVERADPRRGAEAAPENNAFAADLYAKLAAAKQGNLFFSPYSIHSALAMTYAGAGGTTAAQMAKTLHYGLPADRMHGTYAALIENLNTSGREGDVEAFKLVVANALWGQKGYPFQPEFLRVARESYRAGLEEVDFIRASEAARGTINAWVEKQTQDRIKDLVPPGVLTADSRLVLTNAIYFKSNWNDQFSKHATKDEPFFVTPEKRVTAPLMHASRRYNYAEADGVKVVELPYLMRRLSMVVLLPAKPEGMADLERKLTAENLAAWSKAAAARPVKLWLPRFKVTDSFRLAEVLQGMGMTEPFDAKKADFSKMTTNEPLFISEVIHKAFVAVDEEGTEAAAATAVLMAAESAMPRPEEPVEFRADRPFVFAIRHNLTGAILFMGRVVDPTAIEK